MPTRLVEATVQYFVDNFTEAPLFVEGELHPRVLQMLLPTAVDAHPLGFRGAPSPEGFTLRSAGDDGDGIGLTLDVGLDTVDHPCVPAVGEPPRFEPGPPPAVDAGTAARFQWKVDDGVWRPLVAAPGGELVVRDPLLRPVGMHRLSVRAVAEGDYRTLDPTPVVVEVRPTARGRVAAPRGCSSGGRPVGGWWWLALLAVRRRR